MSNLAEHMKTLGYDGWQAIDEVEDGAHVNHLVSGQELRRVEEYLADKHDINLWVRTEQEP